MPAPLAGEIARASHFPKVRILRKPAGQNVTNSTTFVSDTDLTFDLEAERTYLVDARLMVSGPTAADVKTQWVTTGGVSLFLGRHCIGPALTTAGNTDTSVRSSGAHLLSTVISYGTDGTTGSRIWESFILETTTIGTAGTCTLQWAQNTANATATQMTSSAYIVLTEVELI